MLTAEPPSRPNAVVFTGVHCQSARLLYLISAQEITDWCTHGDVIISSAAAAASSLAVITPVHLPIISVCTAYEYVVYVDVIS